MKHYQVSVTEGAFGHHARVEGAEKLWKTSKEGPADAVRACVAGHIFPLALEDAEKAGGAALIRVRQVAVNLWHVETDSDMRPMGAPLLMSEEDFGKGVENKVIPIEKIKVPITQAARSVGRKATRGAASVAKKAHKTAGKALRKAASLFF